MLLDGRLDESVPVPGMPLTQAEQLARHVRQHQRMGLAGRRQRMPTQRAPIWIEEQFAAELIRDVVERLRLELQPLLREMPALLASVAADIRHDEARWDAGESRRVRQQVELATERFRNWMNDARIRGISQKYAGKTATFQREQLMRQLRAALGVDVLMLDRTLGPRIENWIEANGVYIRDLGNKIVAGVQQLLLRALATNQPAHKLAAEINRRFDVGAFRARQIAQHQTSLLYGQLNRDRQLELGITHYRWRSMRDSRVRPEHREREGKIYAWRGKGRSPYIPGEEWGCRCFAEPVMESVLQHMAEISRITVRNPRPEARPRKKRGDQSAGGERIDLLLPI